MKINGNAIRPGNIIEHQGRLWRAVKIAHTQPGKGGAYLQAELKDIRDGTKLNERFRSSETVERVRLDQMDYQFLFSDGEDYTFMNNENYEQITLHIDFIGEDAASFLQEGMTVKIESYEES
ncbi:MAG: elongation factor P, partial [Alphaproteobacteria bacterium]|nr:elongation factor P [Alphaproteobacteria bacterium]